MWIYTQVIYWRMYLSLSLELTSVPSMPFPGGHLVTVHTHPFNGPFPGLPGSASTRKVKPIWILLKREIVSGSGISWAICKSAPRSRQITMPSPHHSVFYRPDALPAAQPTASKHCCCCYIYVKSTVTRYCLQCVRACVRACV